MKISVTATIGGNQWRLDGQEGDQDDYFPLLVISFKNELSKLPGEFKQEIAEAMLQVAIEKLNLTPTTPAKQSEEEQDGK